MNTSWSCRVSTQFEASAHRAVIRKELGGVKRLKQLHHEVVVDILRSADRQDGQDGLRARVRVYISREERRLSCASCKQDAWILGGDLSRTLSGACHLLRYQ